MIAVSLAFDGREGAGRDVHRLAGEDVLIGGGWPELAPFRRGCEAPWLGAAPHPEAAFEELRYHGPARVGTDAPVLTCTQGEAGYLLKAEAGATLWVTGDGARITQCDVGDASSEAPSAELLFGPALLLALALRGTFALHASAVRRGDRVVAFVGPSGAGKSTLAALLAAPEVGCGRVADDILPFALVNGAPRAMPAFPQLKLGAAAQWNGAQPESLSLVAVYRLAQVAVDDAAGNDAPRVVPLHGADAMAALTAHSVATALFGPELLRRHFDAIAAASRVLRIAELRFPRRLDVGPAIRDLLDEDLDG